jgi:hypothetical protein
MQCYVEYPCLLLTAFGIKTLLSMFFQPCGHFENYKFSVLAKSSGLYIKKIHYATKNFSSQLKTTVQESLVLTITECGSKIFLVNNPFYASKNV